MATAGAATLKPRTTGPPPRPGTVITSSLPSPFRSPAATRTPPRKRRRGELAGRRLLGQFGPVADLDVGAAAGVRRGDDVGLAVVVDVAGRHPDAAAEGRVVGGELADQRVGDAVEDADVRAAAD